MKEIFFIVTLVIGVATAQAGCKKGTTKYSCKSIKKAQREFLCSKNSRLDKKTVRERCVKKRRKYKKRIGKKKK